MFIKEIYSVEKNLVDFTMEIGWFPKRLPIIQFRTLEAPHALLHGHANVHNTCSAQIFCVSQNGDFPKPLVSQVKRSTVKIGLAFGNLT